MTTNSATKQNAHGDIIELQEDINKQDGWSNKWQMKYKIGQYAVMHIRHNNINGNYTMTNQQLPVTEQQRDRGIITNVLKWQQET